MYDFSSSSSSSDSEESSCNDDSFADSRRTVVLHMDVDYFYAQCEELELENESERQRPIAVGQKHIIVTCNYIAREHGVKKLQLQTEAKKKCPSLLIVDGSDLERYRKYSARIYKVLRETVHFMAKEHGVETTRIAMKKGGMDEVACDMTDLVNAVLDASGTKNGTQPSLPPNAFVYGNQASSVTLREDQSGAQSTIVANQSLSYHGPTSHHHDDPLLSRNDDELIEKRLMTAAACAEQVRQAIHQQTEFTTSIGISTSPMLSKIASSLNKPNGLSILYPWRASRLIEEMPLRSVPQLGSRTLKALLPCLERYNGGSRQRGGDDFWKCRDLLQVPRHEVLACLQSLNMNEQTSESLCDDLMSKCRGMDPTRIQDDGGGLNKTVSVENSFRRNTIVTPQAVWTAVNELTMRLPRLLKERRTNSNTPSLAYPTTLRLTAATVDKSIQKRRPFATKSKQCSFPSFKALVEETDETRQREILRKAVTPLVHSLVLKNDTGINLVRLNIAVTGFQDLEATTTTSPSTTSTAKSPWATFGTKESHPDRTTKRQRTESTTEELAVASPTSQEGFAKAPAPASAPQSSSLKVDKASSITTLHSLKVDPSVLAELPPDIQEEISRTYKTKPASKRTIADFFGKK